MIGNEMPRHGSAGIIIISSSNKQVIISRLVCTFVAVHVKALASLPLDGSVSAQHPTLSNAAIAGNSSCFCSSEPCKP